MNHAANVSIQRSTRANILPRVKEGPRPIALILAGGSSQRMGMPKPFTPMHGVPLIEHVMQRLRTIFAEVYLVATDSQAFAHLGVPVIQDMGPQQGPLMGLYSGLMASDAEWCFVVGCDMPLLSAPAIAYMAEHLRDADIVAARINGRVQTLHAFYSRRCIPAASHLLSLGTTSLKPLTEGCRSTILPGQDFTRLGLEIASFTDVDTPQELARLEAEVAV